MPAPSENIESGITHWRGSGMHTELLSFNLYKIKKAVMELNSTRGCVHCGFRTLSRYLIACSVDSVVIYNVPVLICDSCGFIIEPKNIYNDIKALLTAEGVERGDYCIPLDFDGYEKSW